MCIYGTGGSGKTTLAALAPGPVRFIDLEDRVGKLYAAGKFGTRVVSAVPGVETYQDVMDALRQDELWTDIRTVVLDSATRIEGLMGPYVCANMPAEKGRLVKNLQDYGWGHGDIYLYEEWGRFLAAMDNHARRGRNVILIAHDCVTEAPNPNGLTYERWEPRLTDPKKGKNSLRAATKEWADDLLAILYDRTVTQDGKGEGSGSRAIYPTEYATCMAKSLTLSNPIIYTEGDDALWRAMFPAGYAG